MKISVITATIRPEGLQMVREGLREQTMQDFEWLVEIGLGFKKDFSAAMNRGIKRAKGDLIVFCNDFIKPPPDGLERFWRAYEENPDMAFVAPMGKQSGGTIRWDWRTHQTWDIPFTHFEMDWCAVPKKLLYEVGGLDEEMDEKCWGPTNVNLGLRLSLAHTLRCLHDNPAVGYDHELTTDREGDLAFHNQRLDEFRRGLRIDYLTP